MTNPLAGVRRGMTTVDRRWRDLPLRTKLTTAAALAATLTIVAVVAVAYVAVRHQLRGQIDHQLRRQVGEVHPTRSFNPVTGLEQLTIPRIVGDLAGYTQFLTPTGPIKGNALPVTDQDLTIANGR